MCIASAAIFTDDNLYTLVKDALGDSYTRPTYYNGNRNDNWQVGKDYCEKVVGGHLPGADELAQIATALYGVEFSADTNKYNRITMKNKDAIYSALGLTDGSSNFKLWSPKPGTTDDAYLREFSTTSSIGGLGNRKYTDIRAVCLGE